MANATEAIGRDLNIWRELSPMTDSNGNTWTPAIPRRWMFVGKRRGVPCRFECELERAIGTDGTRYMAIAVFAHNVHYLCHDPVDLSELEPLD